MKYIIYDDRLPADIGSNVTVVGINSDWKKDKRITRCFFSDFVAYTEYINNMPQNHSTPMCDNILILHADKSGKFQHVRNMLRNKKLIYFDGKDSIFSIEKLMTGYTKITFDYVKNNTKPEIPQIMPTLQIGTHRTLKISNEEYTDNSIDILVVNLNTSDYTINCVNDLLKQDWKEFKVTVIDNASDSSDCKKLKLLEKIDPRVTVIYFESMVHLNAIWNIHAEKSSAKYLCFLNNDVKIPFNFLRDTVLAFSSNPNIGIVNHATNKSEYKTVTDVLEYSICNNVENGKMMRQGWDFSIRRTAYTPIPYDLRVYCGDDFLYYNVYKKNMLCAMVTSSPIIHYLSKSKSSRKVLPEHDIANRIAYTGDTEFEFNTKYSALTPEYSKFSYVTTDASTAKIAVLIQLYWIDLWPEFKTYLSNIKHEYDLYIGLVNGSFSNDELNRFASAVRMFKPNVRVIFVENKGLDIGNVFMQMKSILMSKKRYDVYLKIHSKKSLDTREIFEGKGKGTEWRNELISTICGSEISFYNSMNLLQMQGVGMVASNKWIMDANFNKETILIHGRTLNDYISRLKFMQVSINDFKFVGGTMFFVRGDIWESFFEKMNLDDEYAQFEYGKPGIKGNTSFTHAMERVFGLMLQHNKLKILGL